MKKMLTYYKPYMRVFWTDMFFATLSAAVALIIPLVVRYVTYNLVYREPAEILHQAAYIAIGLFVLVAVDCYSKFYICNYGHVMGAKSSMTCVRKFSHITRNCPFPFMMTRKSDS